MYGGRIHPEKGIHLLVSAMHLVAAARPNIVTNLIVVGVISRSDGGGGDSYLEDLRTLGQGLRLEFLPPIYDRSGFAELLRRVTVFCYPSLAEKGESFGVAPLEAMACGAVPIVSDLPCFKEYVIHGSNGLVFDHRRDGASALAMQLIWLIDNKDKREQLRLAGQAHAGAFGFAECAMILEEKLEGMCKA
ncbi:MAG: glycosyltransferase family 4 protein [Acidobacteria bacterium]|nr:glycosyltransferase family 4 protein [Acidobacteriota bacterium]